MSARTKERGNPVIRCDEEGCSNRWVTQGWWVNAEGGRTQALVMGWTRGFRNSNDGRLRRIDVCPAHSPQGQERGDG